MIEQLPSFNYINNGNLSLYSDADDLHLNLSYAAKLSQIDSSFIEWLDGNPRTELGEKEIIVSLGMLNSYTAYGTVYQDFRVDSINDIDLDALAKVDFDLD